MEVIETKTLELKMDVEEIRMAIREFLAIRANEFHLSPDNCEDAQISFAVKKNDQGKINFSGAVINIRA